MKRLLIVGGGGHGREIIGIVAAVNERSPTFELVGVIDQAGDNSGRLASLGVRVETSNVALEVHEGSYLVAIGDPAQRRRVDELAVHTRAEAATLAHPTASVGLANRIGPGFVAFPNVVVSTNVTTGRHVHLNVGSTVSHDCVLGDYVTLSPGCHVSGNVMLEDDVTLGVGSVVRQGVTIGTGTFVGAGAVVVSDLPPGVTAIGVPARPMESR